MNDPFPLLVANLKANKTWGEMSAWLDIVGPSADKFPGTIIVCPTVAFLAAANLQIKSANLKIKLGSQDISAFEQGPYTGEVTASQIADLCQYAIIGHSERRQNFAESNEVLTQKVQNAQKARIQSIFCIQSDQTPIPEGIKIVAYEPIFAIGTGTPDTPENVQSISQKLKAKGNCAVLYGGSVSAENVNSFLQKDLIDGVLVGVTNSLDPQNFTKIIKAVV